MAITCVRGRQQASCIEPCLEGRVWWGGDTWVHDCRDSEFSEEPHLIGLDEASLLMTEQMNFSFHLFFFSSPLLRGW